MIKNKKLKTNNRNKAFFGAIIQAVGSLVGGQIAREEQERQALQTKKLLDQKNQELENNEIINALNRNIGEGQDIYTSIRRNMKCGGKVRTKADDGLDLTDTIDNTLSTETIYDNINNTSDNNGGGFNVSSSDIAGIVSGLTTVINPLLDRTTKTDDYKLGIQKARLYKVRQRDFGTPKTSLVNNLDTTPDVNQGSPIQFGDRLQRAKCGIKIKRKG